MVGSSKKNKILIFFKNIDLYISMIAFAFIVLVTFMFVLTRYFYSISLPALEEFTVVLFIWFLYFSMMHCMRIHAHIRVNVIDLLLPERGRTAVTVLSNVILLLFNASMVYFSSKLVYFNIGPYGAKSIILGIPDYVVYSILPVSFAIFFVSVAGHIYHDIQLLKAPTSAELDQSRNVVLQSELDGADTFNKE